MPGWVLVAHGYAAQEMYDALTVRFGLLTQCCVVNYREDISKNMLGRLMCDALHSTDHGDGVVFLTDITGAAPYRAAALLSHKHARCEVVSGVSLPLLCELYPQRQAFSSAEQRDWLVAQGSGGVTSLWHQQQQNPPFVLLNKNWLQ